MNSDRLFLAFTPMLLQLAAGQRRARRAHFAAAPASPGQVVLLGDSITEFGLWDAWLPELPVVNRGIGGDRTVDVLDRLDSAIVDPAAVSVLIGTNDLHGPRALRDVDGIAERTREIVRRIRERTSGAPVLLNSVMPRTPLLAPRIHLLNTLYREIAAETGCTYVDLWPALADGDRLRAELTRDNLHLRPAGYRAWVEVLRPHLAPFATR